MVVICLLNLQIGDLKSGEIGLFFLLWLGWCCFAAFTSFSGPLLNVDRATGEQGLAYIFPMNGQVKDTYKKQKVLLMARSIVKYQHIHASMFADIYNNNNNININHHHHLHHQLYLLRITLNGNH